jgi:hypothetical protein
LPKDLQPEQPSPAAPLQQRERKRRSHGFKRKEPNCKKKILYYNLKIMSSTTGAPLVVNHTKILIKVSTKINRLKKKGSSSKPFDKTKRYPLPHQNDW